MSKLNKDIVTIAFFALCFICVFVGNRYFGASIGTEHYSDHDKRYSLVKRTYLTGDDLQAFLTEGSFYKSDKIRQVLDDITYSPDYGTLHARADFIFSPDREGEEINESDIYIVPYLSCPNCRPENEYYYRTYEYSGEISGHHGHWSVPFAKENAEWLTDNGYLVPINYAYTHFRHAFNLQQLQLKLIGNISPAGLDKYSLLLTTYYMHERDSGKAPQYLIGARHVNIYKVLGLAGVALAMMIMYLLHGSFGSKKGIVTGLLLLALSLLNLLIWDSNYMVIGMAVIAIAAVFVMFSVGIGKMVYLLGAVFITDVSLLHYGYSKAFVVNVGLLFIIAVLLLLMNDERPKKLSISMKMM